MEKINNVLSYLMGGLATLVAGITQEWVWFFVTLISLGTFGVNWYYKARADSRAHRAELREIEREKEDANRP